MDLFTLKTRLKADFYLTTNMFFNDLCLIWTNCQAYNQDDSKIYKDSQKLFEITKRKEVEFYETISKWAKNEMLINSKIRLSYDNLLLGENRAIAIVNGPCDINRDDRVVSFADKKRFCEQTGRLDDNDKKLVFNLAKGLDSSATALRGNLFDIDLTKLKYSQFMELMR
jgi:hypothetical protein